MDGTKTPLCYSKPKYVLQKDDRSAISIPGTFMLLRTNHQSETKSRGAGQGPIKNATPGCCSLRSSWVFPAIGRCLMYLLDKRSKIST